VDTGVLGITSRQLHRRSLRSFGYGTAMVARLVRFQRFLALVESTGRSAKSLSAYAVEAGYSDHAHLARDCRSIAGQTPTAFLDDYFPTFPDMSDPYKTTDPLTATMRA
jgi:methylphosphotriester-DNA--protein-cysteine methyltransferase